MSQDVQGMLIQIEATTAQLRRELASADQVVARTTQQIDRNLTTVDSAFDRTAQGAQQAGQLIRGAFAAIAGAGLVGSIIKQADAVGQMADRMRAATEDSREYDMVQNRLMQTAQETYRPLREAQELYIRTADAIKGLGYNTRQTLDITDSFSYLLVTNAASADKASGALDAYSKSLNTGKVEADGWATILSAMPTVVDAVATATGKSAAEIRRLGASGKLALDDLNAGLMETLEANRKAAADMSVSVSDALVNIGNAAQDYIGRLNETSGATDSLAASLKVIADNIDVVGAVIGGVAMGALAVYTRAAALAAVETAKGIRTAVADRAARIAQADAVLQAAIADQRKAQTATILAQREVEAARGTAVQTQMSIQLAQARQREAAATAAVTAAQTSLRQASTGVLALLGGPMGIAMLAGSAAAAFLLMRDNADDAAFSLGDLKTPLEQVRAEFEKLGDAERSLQLTRLSQQIEQEKTKAAGSLDELREAFANSLYGGSGNRAPSPEAEAALGRLGQAMAAASQGQAVNWLEVAESMRGVQGISATLVEKTLAVAAGQETSARTTAELQARHDALTASLDEGTRAQRENAAAAAAAAEAGDKYIAQLQQRLNTLQDKTALDAANRFIAENTGLTDKQIIKIRELAAAQDAQRAADARATAGRKASKSSIDEQLRAIDAVIDRALPERKRLEDLAKAQEDLRKAHAAGKVTAAELEQGLKNLNKQYEDPAIRKAEEAQKKANAELKRQRDAVQGVLDRLDPLARATRVYGDEQDMLREALERGDITLGQYETALAALGKEYQRNSGQMGLWAELTEGALDRIDGAFADMWGSVLSGSKNTLDQLKAAMLQTLAEMAHAAITKPIIMQIGAALGIGGGTGQAVSMLGGSAGSGGMDVFGLLKNGYSIANSGFGQAVAQGWGNGGFSGAISSGWNYGSNALGGFFGGGAASSGGSAIADYTGSQFSNWVGAQNAAATTWGGAATGLGSIMGGLSGAYMGYQRAGVKGAVAGGLGGWGGGTLGTMAGAAAASALSGTAMGAAIGSILPGIGTVIGAALGAAFGSKLFGGAWETKDAGLAFSVTDGDFLGQQYEYQKKKGGLFSSNKKRTRFSALDDETAARFQSVYDATEDTVAGLFESLSYSVEEASLAGLQLARTKISTKGKTEEQIQEAIAEWFGSAANAMTAELNKVFATGLDLDLEGMQAFVGNLQGVNEVLRYLDVGMYDASVSGGKLAEALSAAAGGLDALAANSATYYDAFFSAEEKAADTIDAIKRAFESADVELAASREAYRAMVEDIDLTTEAGQKMFATLMALSGQAAQYYSIVEQQAAAAAAQALANTQLYYDQFTTGAQKADDVLAAVTVQFSALEVALPATRGGFIAAVDALDRSTEAGQRMFSVLMGAAGAADAYYDILEARAASVSAGTANAAVAASRGALSTLSAAINAEKSSIASAYQSHANSIRSAIGSANDSLSQMRSVAGSLRSAVNGLRLESEQYAAQSRRSAQQAIGQALSAGGRVQMTEQLERALGTVSQSSEALFGSFEDYARDYWQTYFAIEQLAERAEEQLSADERAVKALERQLDQSQRFHDAEIERLDGVLEGANAQLEALLGIDTSVQSVEAALAAFTAALSAAQQLQHANSSITSVTGLGGVKRQVTSEGYILDELGNQMELFGEAMRVVGGKVVGGAGASLNIGADGQLSWGAGDYAKWAKQAGIPGFATGGSHVGGLRVVGEHGPELELTGPARLLNANQTAAALRGDSSGELVAEVRALRQTVAAQGAELRDIARSSDETRKALRQQNEVGVPAWSG
ncbi:MAG TPA: hypothetical protein DEO97_13865 [Pseudomonas sp.]|nr:hypothetical protein [Pseudomonas sp.]